MRASARVVPAAKMVRAMSVPSGLVRRGWTRKSLDRQGMAGFVRNVRRFFYCLTYARDFFLTSKQWCYFSWDIEKERTRRTTVLNNWIR